jgi:hypothetical protein
MKLPIIEGKLVRLNEDDWEDWSFLKFTRNKKCQLIELAFLDISKR